VRAGQRRRQDDAGSGPLRKSQGDVAIVLEDLR
jgi:hypothetical protein